MAIRLLVCMLAVFAFLPWCYAQEPAIRYGSEVPSEVRTIYRRGLSYLVQSQREDGHWDASAHGHGGPGDSGITGVSNPIGNLTPVRLAIQLSRCGSTRQLLIMIRWIRFRLNRQRFV